MSLYWKQWEMFDDGTSYTVRGDAAEIVRKVESHGALVRGMESLLDSWESGSLAAVGWDEERAIVKDRMAAARAALAAAKGETQ